MDNDKNKIILDYTKYWEDCLKECKGDALANVLSKILNIFNDVVEKSSYDNEIKLNELRTCVVSGLAKKGSDTLINHVIPHCKANEITNSMIVNRILDMKLNMSSILKSLDEEYIGNYLLETFSLLRECPVGQIKLGVSFLMDGLIKQNEELQEIMKIMSNIASGININNNTLGDFLVENIREHLQQHVNWISFDEYIYQIIRITGMLYTYFWKDGHPFEPFLSSFEGSLKSAILSKSVKVIKKVYYIINEFEAANSRLDDLHSLLDDTCVDLNYVGDVPYQDCDDVITQFTQYINTIVDPMSLMESNNNIIAFLTAQGLLSDQRYEMIDYLVSEILENDTISYAGGCLCVDLCHQLSSHSFIEDFFIILKLKIDYLHDTILQSDNIQHITYSLRTFTHFFVEFYDKFTINSKRISEFGDILLYLLERLIIVGHQDDITFVSNIIIGHANSLQYIHNFNKINDLLGITPHVTTDDVDETYADDNEFDDFRRFIILKYMDFPFI